MRAAFAVAALSLLVAPAASAEVFFELKYHATFGQVKAIYPNARYEKLAPAWLTASQAFYRMTGTGFPATVYVAFEDLRPEARKMIGAGNPGAELLKDFASASDEDALTIQWVRVVYPTSVPMNVFSERYGKPSKCERNATFDMECRWDASAILATMSRDGSFVEMATTSFTKAERHDGYLSRGLEIPSWDR